MAERKKDDLNKDKDEKCNEIYNIHEGGKLVKNIIEKIEDGGNVQQNVENNYVFNINGDHLDPQFLEDLSQWIKTQRNKKNMTQKELSKRSDIDLKYLQKLESTRVLIQPRIETIQKIVNALGTTLRINFSS